jgi:hypothetical protein
LHIPFQLEHLRVEHQVNFFMGCDCHIHLGQALTEDSLSALTVIAEELPCLQFQPDGDFSPG